MTAFPIPIEALSQHVAIIGKTGTGKSFTARGLVERLLDEGRRVCIVDPTGVWYGLKSNAKGDGPGYPVAVFGGDHADVAITVGAAKALGQIIAERNLPAVVDVSDFNMTERYQFGEAFFRSLHAANRAPLHLILDEADEFARQQPMPEQRRVLHEVDRIVRRGRVRGFRVVFITQRPAVLHKNVLTQANALIAMRLTSPQDRKAFDEWIKGQADEAQGREVAGSLSSLKKGEGWIWAPELGILDRVTFPAIKTFDTMRAPTDGETVAEPLNLADVDLSEIRDAFADAEQEARANDPKALKAEIARLKGEMQKAATNIPENIPAADPAAIDEARSEGYQAGYADGAEVTRQAVIPTVQELGDRFFAATASVMEAKEAVRAFVDGWRAPQMPVEPAHRPTPIVPPKPTPRARPSSPKANGSTPEFTGPQQRIIASLAFWHSIGHDAPSREQVAAVAGYRPGSGGFNNLLGGLRSAGAIDYPSPGRVSLQLAIEDPMSPAAARDMLLSILTGPQKKVIEAVRVTGGGTREAIASESGYSAGSGGFNNLLGSLRTLGVLIYPAKGEVALANWAGELLG